MLKFSIIGANSSLARNFVYFLQDKNIELNLYDIQDKQFDGLENYLQINFHDVNDVNKIEFDCDAVFVFIGLTGAALSMNEANRFIDINEKILVNILDAIKRRNAKCKIIYPSSRLVYKDVDHKLKETDSLEAKSVYALNKIFAENILRLYQQLFDIKYTIFRIAIPFGELNPSSNKYGILAALVEQSKKGEISLYGDGSGIRTFTHVLNICEALYFGGTSTTTDNQIFNIGGKAYTLFEIAKLISKINESKIVFYPWPEDLIKVEVKNGHLDSSKLDKLFDINYIDIKESLL